METISSSELNDKKIGVLASVATLLIVFLLLYISTIDNSKTKTHTITLVTDIPLETIQEFKEVTPVTEKGGGGGGGGTPSNDKVDPTPKPQTDHVVTSQSSEAVTMKGNGKSNKTTAENSQNTATSTKKSKNLFTSDGGNGDGTGGGVGKGKGIGFGPDTGEGKGLGNGPGSGGGNAGARRIRLNDPNVDNIESDVDNKINLRVKIDENGNVISAISTSRTTTTSQTIINKVIAATINQAKYNKKPGAGIEEAFITIILNAR